MNHKVEMSLVKYLSSVLQGKGSMSKSTINSVSKAIKESLNRQFNGGGRDEFRLRMSAIGRPYCQLWYDKNKREAAVEKTPSFLLQMVIGDIVEAVVNGVMVESGIELTASEQTKLKLGKHSITGSTDPSFEPVTDTKSASQYSYNYKFTDWQTLADNDSFGYVAQGVGYAKALGKKFNGWFVVNKSSGEFKFVPYEADEKFNEKVLNDVEKKLDKLEENKFERCFSPVEETFRKKPTGNKILPIECKFCDYKFDCWKGFISEEPSRVSSAKDKPMVYYLTA